MKILVIGGSYFYGRVFVMTAAGMHDITVVNRGTYSMKEFGVKEIKGDRKLPETWKNLKDDFDVVVDFCAYDAGDIRTVLDYISGTVKQYILISTVDVYKRYSPQNVGNDFSMETEDMEETKKSSTYLLKDENTPYEEAAFAGDVGAYISGKVAAEKELVKLCTQKGIYYTIIRPAILYGPFNYAPRESLFIRMIVQNGVVPYIEDATGHFQFTYIKDGVQAILAVMGNEAAYNEAFNICDGHILSYDTFYAKLKESADCSYEEIHVPYQEAVEKGIPVPFPATAFETELYTNEKSVQVLGMQYTSLSEGMKKTYNAFKNVYQ